MTSTPERGYVMLTSKVIILAPNGKLVSLKALSNCIIATLGRYTLYFDVFFLNE